MNWTAVLAIGPIFLLIGCGVALWLIEDLLNPIDADPRDGAHNPEKCYICLAENSAEEKLEERS